MAERISWDKNTSYISDEKKKSLRSLIENNKPQSEEDLLVLVIHVVLLRHKLQFVCVGAYQDEDGPPLGLRSEILPENWNRQTDSDCYEFCYLNTEKQTLYNLNGLRIEDKLCFTLLERGKSNASATQVQVAVNDHVIRKDKPVSYEWLVDAGFLWKLIERGLFNEHEDLLEKRDEEMDIKVMELERPHLEMRRPPQMLAHENVPIHHPDIFREANRFERQSPFAYGDADRLPGHPGFGGMMMDPLRSGGMGLRPPGYPGIPRGSVPPGARFDPFGPATEFDYSSGNMRPNRFFDPNPDHLRRPGFHEDMFM